ncbi:uncharacterized protein LOC131249317 [Magnolia sinica]|uniref:uncharacterized protein LOC131249317 n=1 Tax=Magnolia sinica TaxID=86752 RepID=UPI002658B3CA|nr:uncharacterized protein LOC131249317 [Magnolia sinica]
MIFIFYFFFCCIVGQNDQGLRQAISDITPEVEKITKNMNLSVQINDVEKAECECCGLSEDCTPAYIGQIKDLYYGKWVCGLCSEAVKEHMNRVPKIAMEEAVDSHMNFCKKFNRTARLNPNLSLAGAMREIARRSSQYRNSKSLTTSKIARTNSCNPRINFQINRPGSNDHVEARKY